MSHFCTHGCWGVWQDEVWLTGGIVLKIMVNANLQLRTSISSNEHHTRFDHYTKGGSASVSARVPHARIGSYPSPWFRANRKPIGPESADRKRGRQNRATILQRPSQFRAPMFAHPPVALNAVGRRNAQKSAKEGKWAPESVNASTQKSAKGRKDAQKSTSALKLQTTRCVQVIIGNLRVGTLKIWAHWDLEKLQQFHADTFAQNLSWLWLPEVLCFFGGLIVHCSHFVGWIDWQLPSWGHLVVRTLKGRGRPSPNNLLRLSFRNSLARQKTMTVDRTNVARLI